MVRRWIGGALVCWLALVGHAAADTHPHFDVVADIDPGAGSISVDATVSVEGRSAFVYQLASWMTVDRVTVNGEPLATHGPGSVPLPDAGRHEIGFRLSGAPPPMPENPGRGFRGTALGPTGGFLPAGSGWLPLTGDDFVTYRLRVRIPSPQIAVVTGNLSEEQTADGHYTATFEAPFPKDPPSLFTGPFRVDERMHGDLRLRTYFADAIQDYTDLYLDRTARYLDTLTDRIGDYPYDGFSVVAGPLPVGLGFAGLTYIGQRIVPLPFMQGRSLAHEITHSWWGNAVGVDYASGNWAEGLTTYMADYALAAQAGDEAARDMRLGWLRDYAALPSERDTRVVDFVTKSHDAAQIVGYNKVAFMFHMLRNRIGETAFRSAIQRFWINHRNGIAGWRDIAAAFETASGQDLSDFFGQWLTRAGAPRIMLADAQMIDDATVRVTLRQSAPVYDVRVPIVIETSAGSQRHIVTMGAAEQSYDITTGAQPLRVAVDPDFDVFRKLLPGESAPILRDVTLATNPIAVIVTEDKAFSDVASTLRRALFRGRAVASIPLEGNVPEQPFVLIGTGKDIIAALAAWNLGAPPDNVMRGQGAAWTLRTPDGHAGLIVRADGAKALAGMVRSLPHYGRRGFVVYGPDGVVDRGTREVTDSPLSRRVSAIRAD